MEQLQEGIIVNIEGRQGRVTRILPRYDYLLDKQLGFTAIIEFEPDFDGTLSVGVLIPAKRYQRQEFITEVEHALRHWVARQQQQKLNRKRQDSEFAQMKDLADSVAKDLGLKENASL